MDGNGKGMLPFTTPYIGLSRIQHLYMMMHVAFIIMEWKKECARVP